MIDRLEHLIVITIKYIYHQQLVCSSNRQLDILVVKFK